MSPSRERNDRKTPPASGGGAPPRGSRRGPPDARRRAPQPDDGSEWLWGWHAVEAAVANPARELKRLLATPDRARSLEGLLSRRGGGEVRVETVEAAEVARALPDRAVHQGVALLTAELEDFGLDAAADPAHGVIVVLDQVTDPQNVGAILRSAAAFGARAIVLQERRSPALSGALAKAAAGAVEKTPIVRVVNLSRALDRLADLGWKAVGLAGEATSSLPEAIAGFAGEPIVLVLGSEGEGLRRLVSEHCDVLARIGMPGGFESLNVSAAAAVALYETARGATRQG